MMQSVGRRYVRRINTRWKRTGTLWEGRFRSSLVDSGEYALACYRYIELNPVRAKMVGAPADCPWWSYRANAFDRDDGLTRPHPAFVALGEHPDERRLRYREWVAAGTHPDELDGIHTHTEQGKA